MHLPSYLSSSLALVPGFTHLGRLHLPVFGIIAAGGIVAALLLSQRTARLSGVDPDRLWDAAILTVISAFLASRLLLVAMNLKLFLKQPLLVLAQPSLTVGGVLLAAFAVGFWLRRHQLPWRKVLDAWAAPGALLAAVLQLGHFLEGTDAGMPTSLPWGVHTPGNLTLGRVHPVQLYAIAMYAGLGVWLLARLRKPLGAGRIAASGLLMGGAMSFSLSFLRQPYDAFGSAWLDPGQYAALLGMLAGAGVWVSGKLLQQQRRPSPLTLAEEIR